MPRGRHDGVESKRSFAARPESVAEARRFVAHTLADTGADAEVAVLLTSELVTNAVKHANSGFEVRITFNSHQARIEIINDDPELLLALKQPSEQGGRGLRIVEDLADDWGTESSRENKVVWFMLRTD